MCLVDRTKSIKGACGESSKMRLAWAGLHKGEEPPISGDKGSGMLFFVGCPLGCAYCQNVQISSPKENIGIEVSEIELAHLMLSLQKEGASSINLVTGTHFIPSIVESIISAKKNGLSIPIVWNSSGYERVEALKLIDSYIDIYLLDYKTRSKEVASIFCGKEKYVDTIDSVLGFVKNTHGELSIEKGRGTILRHLVFPKRIRETKDVLIDFSKKYKDSFYLSLMVQFVPPKGEEFPLITDSEYYTLLSFLEELGIEEGFAQEKKDDDIFWIPDFNKDVPFPLSFASVDPYFLELKKEKCKTI